VCMVCPMDSQPVGGRGPAPIRAGYTEAVAGSALQVGQKIMLDRFPYSLYEGVVKRVEPLVDGVRVHYERGGSTVVRSGESIYVQPDDG
jgi:hypothetical protein